MILEALADAEAVSIVAEGLNLSGEKRQRFCSPDCARMAYEHRFYAQVSREYAIAKNAYQVIKSMRRRPPFAGTASSRSIGYTCYTLRE